MRRTSAVPALLALLLATALPASSGPPAAAAETVGPAEADEAAESDGTGGAENGERLMDTVALYPRAIEIAHTGPQAGADPGTIVLSVVTFVDEGRGLGAIFESTDHGRSFDRIGTVADPSATEGLCCATLYELPQQVGDLPAGTLLWSASVGQDAGADRRMTMPVWASSDGGHTWEHLSTIAASPNSGGLWEPEFTVDPQGRLVVYYADESQQPQYSQTLVQAVSEDGLSWSEPENIFAAEDPDLRPGMPVVRPTPQGDYLMSFEVCGPGMDCQHRMTRSPDATSWGEVGDLGQALLARSGEQFRHAPTISWYDDGTRGGRWLAIGQVLVDRHGQVDAGNGSTLFTSRYLPASWHTAPAPVHIRDPYNDYCPNYSSTLLPLPQRDELLQVATGYADDGECTAYFRVADLTR